MRLEQVRKSCTEPTLKMCCLKVSKITSPIYYFSWYSLISINVSNTSRHDVYLTTQLIEFNFPYKSCLDLNCANAHYVVDIRMIFN